MATTLDVERQLSNAGYMPQGVDFSPRFTAPADIEGIVRGAAGRYGLNPDDAVAVARLESGLNPRAQNPTSSAGGLFQFINSTWGQYGGGDKYDPARNADAGARYLRDVRDTLTRGLGRAPTVGELYLGHQQGAAGALRILQNPDGLARDAVGPDAVVLNGGTIDMTNRDFAMRWDRRASRAAGQAPGILDTIGAAARQNIGLAGLLGYGMPFHRGADDPTFNAIATADADPALRPYLSQFIDVRNREEYDRTAERVRRASDDKETLAAAGAFGMAASVAAGILDPINLIPVGGGAWKLFKAGRYVEGALGGIIAGGGGAALQELMLQQADPTRTAEDAGLNIVSGALGGAGLGVGSVAASGSASRLARAGILGAGGAAGGAAAGVGEALYSGQDIGGALATIGTSAVIGGLLGGSVGALARHGRTARDGLHDLARTVDIETDTGNGAIYSDVRRQLLAAGRPEAEADAGGKLWQSHVDAVSRATGVPQDEVYRGIGLDVRAGEMPEGALAQAAYHGTPQDVELLASQVKERRRLDMLQIFKTNAGDLHIAMIEVAKAERSRGVGTSAMQDIIAFADQHGMRITLTPGLKDALHGTTSRARLVKFYKRFGFVENKGRNKDFSISDGMYREPRRTLAQDARGAVQFGPDMARITLGAKADASTFLHESGHVFLNTLDRLAAQTPELSADMKTVREWLGNDGGAITRDQHEQWARGFEAYLRDGKAPNGALSEVFARFRDWLTSIYRSLTDLNVELSDDMRGVMDRLIGVDQEPTTGRGGSLSAAAIPAATADDLRIARGAELPARILARIPIVRGPDIILGTSPVRAARWAMRKLIRPALMTEGDLAGRAEVATENVESAMQQWHGGEVTAKHQANAIYTEYAKAAAKTGEPVLKAQDIIDAASMAGRRGDSGAKLALGPEAQKAAAATAKAYREAVFDPLLKQALEHGLLTKAQVEKARRFADSYIPRVWNINKILEKRTQFTNEVVMPQVVRDWEESRAKLARMRQVTRFADEQLRQIEAAGIEYGGADAAALIAEGADRSPAQIMRENIKQIKAALDDPAAQWADGDEDRARFLLAKSRTPVIAQGGMEGIRKGGPALTDVEAQELQDMLYRTHGLRPADPTDIGVRATRAVQAMRARAATLGEAAKVAKVAKLPDADKNDTPGKITRLAAAQRQAQRDLRRVDKEMSRIADRIAMMTSGGVNPSDIASQMAIVRSRRPAEPKSLFTWLRANGGLSDDGGELSARDMGGPAGIVRKTGMHLDDAALKAWEAGYLGKGTEDRPSIDDLLAAVDAEAAGRKQYRIEDEETLDRIAAHDDAAAWVAELAGIPASQLAKMSDEQIMASISERGETAIRAVDRIDELRKAERGLGAKQAAMRADIERMSGDEAVARDNLRIARDLQSARDAEATRLMTEQATKLANDAAAVSTLADQYETALKKSLRERAKAYRAIDADDALGRLDEEDLPGVASDIVDALVGHTNNRVQYEGLKVTARGALKEKTFNVRDELVDGGNGGENWLENDIELLASRYTRTLAPDVELKRLTGDVNAEPLRQEIIQEYIDRSNAMEDGPKKRKLDARLKRDIEAFDGVVSRMRGTYGVPKDAGEVWGLRAARLLKAFNFVRLMGNGPISQIGDVGRIVFRSGMSRFLGDAVMPMISNWDAVKLTKRELQQADIATELVRSSMALRGAEMFDEYSNTTKIEQLANKAAAGASRLYGLDHWNQGNKTIAGMIAQSSLVDGVRKLAAGGDMKPIEIADMSRVGIGAREAEQLKPFLDEFGQDVHGIFIPNTADWAGDGAADAVRLWRGAMRQIADDMIINPGQDRSLFLSKPFRSMLFQLETFNLVSTQRTILAGLQRRDAGVFIGAGMMVGLGMLSYWLKAKIAGLVFGSTSTWKLPDSPGDWLLQGINQSGLLGAFGSLDQRLLAATRGTVGSEALVGSPTRSRFAAADFASLFGPSASAGQIAFTSLQNAAAGDWNWKDTHRLRSLAPMQNYFIVRGIFDQAEKRLNDVMGVRRPVQQR